MTRTRQARSRRRRGFSPFLLLSALLAAALVPLTAEGSLPRTSLDATNTAAQAGAEAGDSGQILAAGLETPFTLLAGDELEKALACGPAPPPESLASAEGSRLEPPQLTSRACEESFSLHLEPVDFGLNPQRGPPFEIPDLHQGRFVADPKTRIGGFRLNPEDFIGGERHLSLGLHRGYLVGRPGFTEDEPPDPWGLATVKKSKSAAQDVPCPFPANPTGYPSVCQDYVPAGTVEAASTSVSRDSNEYGADLRRAGLEAEDVQVLRNRYDRSGGNRARIQAAAKGVEIAKPAVDAAGIGIIVFGTVMTGSLAGETGPLVTIGSGGEMAAEARMAAAMARLNRIRNGQGIGRKGRFLEEYLAATKVKEGSAILNVQRANGTGFDLVSIENGEVFINEAKFVEGEVGAGEVTAFGLHNVGRTTGGNMRLAVNKAQASEMLDVVRALQQKNVTVRFVGGPNTTWDTAEITRRLANQGFDKVTFENVTEEQMLKYILSRGSQ